MTSLSLSDTGNQYIVSAATPLEMHLYESKYHREVVELITSIQQEEFNLPIIYEEQFDLKNMEATYNKSNGNFWLAFHDGTLAGTIGLIDVGSQTAALKKLFVRKEYRGKTLNVGQHLLDILLNWSNEKDFKHIYLGTTDKMLAAHRFYERNGFSPIANETLPDSIHKTRAKVDTKHYYRAL